MINEDGEEGVEKLCGAKEELLNFLTSFRCFVNHLDIRNVFISVQIGF